IVTGNLLRPSVGGIAGAIGRDAITRETSQFRNDLSTLVSRETLQSFLELKDQGATFGAMSDSEWAIIEKAATDLGFLDGGKSNLSEAEFKRRAQSIARSAMKLFIRNNMTAQQYEAAGLQFTDDNAKVRAAFDAIKSNVGQSATSSGIDYASQDISSA